MTQHSTLLGRFRRAEEGVAAVEMALISAVFCAAVMNATELCKYAYSQTQVTAASQAGVSAALATCDSQHVPATTSCPDLNTAVTTAIRSTSLGTGVTVSQITEAYYCLDLNNRLQYVQSASSAPADCSAVNNPSASPALYMSIAIGYQYTSLFPGSTIISALPQQISRTSWMRMT